MKVTHLIENHIYLISNHAVARNPMFADIKIQEFFISKIEKYLTPLCNIIAYNLNGDEFQLLIKLNSREKFKSFYKIKKNNELLGELEIPESTFIFSQEMANLQVSLVKHFNYKYKRNGAMMAKRFGRELIESVDDMNYWIERLNKGKKLHQYGQMWANEIMNLKEPKTSKWLYSGEFKGERGFSSIYLSALKIDLGGAFENLPADRIILPKSYLNIQLNLILSKLNQSF